MMRMLTPRAIQAKTCSAVPMKLTSAAVSAAACSRSASPVCTLYCWPTVFCRSLTSWVSLSPDRPCT